MSSKLKEMRTRSKLLQRDVAEILNESPGFISKLERGLLPITQLNRWLLALIYDCNVSELNEIPIPNVVKKITIGNWFHATYKSKRLSVKQWAKKTRVEVDVITEMLSGKVLPERPQMRKLLIALFPENISINNRSYKNG